MFAAIGTAFDIAWLLIRLLVLVGIPAAVITRAVIAVIRFALLPRVAKRNYPAALWHRFRWRWLCRALDLAWIDQHRKTVKPIPAGTAVTIRVSHRDRQKLRYPRARFRADSYGVTARVRTVPKVSLAELESNAEHIRNAWRCVRVSVSQPEPGVCEVRGLRRDPLSEPLSASVLPVFDGRRVTLARDEWGTMRRADLANHAGSVWAGNPGRGKTEAALSLAVQLAPSPLVDMWVLDGGANDWRHFADGAAGYVDDDLEAAEDMLAGLDRKMRDRRRTLESDLGVRNAWRVGPTEAYRLQWVIIEEAPFYLSLDAVKGDKKREARVIACRGFAAGLLRRGRAPLFHTSMIGQKITTSSIPPDLRDLCGLRWSFGCATIDAAVAALGDDIRQYDTLQPTLLQGDEHVGVATVLMKSALSLYTMMKFPEVGEKLADQVALKAAQLRHPESYSPASEGQPSPTPTVVPEIMPPPASAAS